MTADTRHRQAVTIRPGAHAGPVRLGRARPTTAQHEKGYPAMPHRTGWFRTRLAERRAQDPEEGSWVSMLAVVMLVWVVLVIAGYVVDGSAQTRALLYAETIAGQSARYGAQTLDPAFLADGQAPTLDPVRAAAEAEAYLAGYDSELFHVTGTCRVADATTVVCDTTVTYDTILLGIISIDTLTGHGHAQAEAIRTLNGQPR